MLSGRNVEVKLSLPSSYEIAFTCHFARDAEQLYEAWTKPEHLKQWWGCEGSVITSCAIDLREGGSWELVMKMPDGSEHPFHGMYEQIVSPNRLVYTECYDRSAGVGTLTSPSMPICKRRIGPPPNSKALT